MAMAGDEVVGGVADRAGKDDTQRGASGPHASHVAADGQSGRRADVHAFTRTAGIVDPDHRVRASDIRMAGADLSSGFALERRESEQVLPLVAEDELYARGAEAAGTVVEKQRRVTA